MKLSPGVDGNSVGIENKIAAVWNPPATVWDQLDGNPIPVSYFGDSEYSRNKAEAGSGEIRQKTTSRHNTAERGNPI